MGKGGVVRDPTVHRQVLMDLLTWAEVQGWSVRGLIPSPLRGPAGNVEFLAHLKHAAPSVLAIEAVIETALAAVEEARSTP